MSFAQRAGNALRKLDLTPQYRLSQSYFGGLEKENAR